MQRRAALLVTVALCASLAAQPATFDPVHYERILVPLLIPQAPGAFGAVFATDLSLMGSEEQRSVLVYGIRAGCLHVPCPNQGLDAVNVGSGEDRLSPGAVQYDGTPGRFMYVARHQVPRLYGHLRVRDITRSAQNLGTEIPLVRESDFIRTGEMVFRNEYPSKLYRSSLRLYAPQAMRVHVTVVDEYGNETAHNVDLHATGSTIYDPHYAYFADFPAHGWFALHLKADVEKPFWAFATLTNNETQMITTITPQP
ncbi:MAG TPA: hypothetical protein VGF28_17300 [Thermoanaerobaculia bacterium]